MKTSNKGLNLIKTFEGLRLKAYKCPSGVLTIGYGHTHDVKAGQVISEAEADDMLKKDIIEAEKIVNSMGWIYRYSQEQFDALVSFTFNCGFDNFITLTADGTRSLQEVGEKLTAYVKSNGKTLNGLVKRRKLEQALFFSSAIGYSEVEELIPLKLDNILVKVADNYRIRVAPSADSEVIAYTDCTKKPWYEIHGYTDNWILTDKGFIHKDAFPLKIK